MDLDHDHRGEKHGCGSGLLLEVWACHMLAGETEHGLDLSGLSCVK